MKLYEVLPALEAGHAIRRRSIGARSLLYIKDRLLYSPYDGMYMRVLKLDVVEDVFSDDWEVVKIEKLNEPSNSEKPSVSSPMSVDIADIIDKMAGDGLTNDEKRVIQQQIIEPVIKNNIKMFILNNKPEKGSTYYGRLQRF